jgi:hypothetical protein
MKKLYILLISLVLTSSNFGKSKIELENRTEFKVGPGPTFWKFFLLPVTSFLPIWGAYDEGSHTNDNTPLLNFDRDME